MRVAYLVSRFPQVSETFVVRELDAVDKCDGIDVELYSLFPALPGPIHPVAERWVARRRQAGKASALRGLAWAAIRRPAALGRILGRIAIAHARTPRHLVRALVTVPVAASHALDMRTKGIDHVHAHWATYPTLAAWMIKRLVGIPYSFTAHAHDIFVDQSMLDVKIREARVVVTISDFNRAFLTPFGAGTASPVEIVRYGVDLERFRYRERELPAGGRVRALCVAALQEKKGHRFLFEALAGADGALVHMELDLVGGGDMRAELELLASSLGLAERVHFHGQQTEPEIAKLMGRADLLVLPSIVARDGQMEGLPNVIIEALASGLPVVTTRLSGTPELVREGETGTLAEPADSASMRAALERALSQLADPMVAQARGRAGRAAVEARHDLRASADQMAALFASLPGRAESS